MNLSDFKEGDPVIIAPHQRDGIIDYRKCKKGVVSMVGSIWVFVVDDIKGRTYATAAQNLIKQ